MTSRLADRLARLRLLALARLALVTGDVEGALGLLCDPRLDRSARAQALRERLRSSTPERENPGSRIRRVEALLGDLRAEVETLARRSTQAEAPASARFALGLAGPSAIGPAPPAAARASRRVPRSWAGPLRCATAEGGSFAGDVEAARACRLAVDDGGEFLLVAGRSFVIGHLRGGLADLPLFADLEPRHAKLVRGESFHGGATWRLSALAGVDLRVRRGVAVALPAPAGGVAVELADGDLVELGARAAFRFELPDASSVTARLELLHGLECLGASRLLLLAPGGAGRIRVGARRGRHVPLVDVDEDLVLEQTSPDTLRVSHAPGLVFPDESGPVSERDLSLPPSVRIDFELVRSSFGTDPSSALGPAREEPQGHGPGRSRRPIGVSLSPLEELA